MFHVEIGQTIEDDELRSLVDGCEDFWKDFELDNLSIASAPTLTSDDSEVDLFDVVFDVEEENDDEVVNLMSEVPSDDKEKKNRKRRLNEVERLQEFSWQRVPREETEAEKRVRYD